MRALTIFAVLIAVVTVVVGVALAVAAVVAMVVVAFFMGAFLLDPGLLRPLLDDEIAIVSRAKGMVQDAFRKV